ncbi:MAG: RHS repeat-associated core domain-containing protein, partial [Chloroflexi bacterium]|nr:RHS repeat-associated core domain-containing protein [Chloroflexota bacterium]
SGQYGKGRRTGLSDSCGGGTFRWDAAGRLALEKRVLDGFTYITQTTYDALDRPYQATLPDGEVLTHTYGPHGLLSQLSSSLGPSLVSGVQYNALNLPKSFILGSSPSETTVAQTYYGLDGVGLTGGCMVSMLTLKVMRSYYGLDGVGLTGGVYGALRSLQWPPSPNALLVNRSMEYDPAGNVTRIIDGTQSPEGDLTYTYDHLDRLLSASGPGLSESYEYNQIGNLTRKNSQDYQYLDPAHKHAVSAVVGGSSYLYDANGSMTQHGTQTIKYDPQRRPVRLDSGGATVWRTAYDGDGVRRKRLDQSGTIHYLGAYERNVGNGLDTTEVVTKYYGATLGAVTRLIAFRKNGVLSWMGTDHLGSTIRVANASFASVDGMRYTLYGVSRDPGSALTTDHKFTSQVEDASIGLYWYHSRAYDPGLGRFVQPDSIVPEPGSPQALNRYSYARNNPLNRLDPTGHWDLSTYDGRQAARDYYAGLGIRVVVDDQGIYFPDTGITTDQDGNVTRFTGPEGPSSGGGGGGSSDIQRAIDFLANAYFGTGGANVPAVLSYDFEFLWELRRDLRAEYS